ncbi:unnamed protein product [Arabis nemorensis]|uniref:Uncharacterized protein n=1 Tax=Arabis nemorensis TaxID=586526 RepID=A0A565BBX5_9BRAS|nr:unnamed protein product [Arabis nemorensis]
MYFAQERFDDAAEAIEKASKFDPHNIEVQIYKKILKLIQRALSNNKLEKWAEAIRDYEILSQTLPCDKYIAKSLFQAQVALRFSRDVKKFLCLDEFLNCIGPYRKVIS